MIDFQRKCMFASGAMVAVTLVFQTFVVADGLGYELSALPTCAVSSESLGSDTASPRAFTHRGRTIGLCGNGCLKAFDTKPAKFVTEVNEGAKEVKPYPLAAWSDEGIDGAHGLDESREEMSRKCQLMEDR